MESQISTSQEKGDDIVRVRQSTLIGLHREAKNIPLFSDSVKAQRSGNYLSSFRGRGMEYHESRPYQAGDDIRAIDWRVTARSGRTHTKVYREERERPVLLWVDLCRSMFFGTRNCFKSVLASRLAALLAWSSIQHGDRLGGLIFSEQDHFEFRPRSGKSAALHFIRKLTSHSAWDQGEVSTNSGDTGLLALNRLRQVARPGSLVVLISDFRLLEDSWRVHLSRLSRHNDVVLLFTHDPLEQALPPAGYYRLTDGSTEIGVDSSNRGSRQQYEQRFDAHYQALVQLSRQLGLHFVDASTASDLLEVLKTGFGADPRK
ncbi:MAG: DUF58 domain-containing protein [Gammaproteobacteria bacterium]